MAIVSSSLDDPEQTCDPLINNRPFALHRRRRHFPKKNRIPEWPANLPTEMIFAIFKFLPQADLARACRVCRSWNTVASDATLWRNVDLSYITKRTRCTPSLVKRLHSAESLMMVGRLDARQCFTRQLIRRTVKSNQRITSISFYACLDLSGILFKFFGDWLKNLRHVNLSYCQHVQSRHIMKLIQSRLPLRTLNLSYTGINRRALERLHELEHLTDLSLKGCFDIESQDMFEFLLTGLPPRLSRLNLSYLFTVQGEWLVDMSSRVKLELLDVRCAEYITRSDVRKIQERWGNKCQVLATAKLETDDEQGWIQFVEELVEADVVR